MPEPGGNSLRLVWWLAPLATALVGYALGRAQHASNPIEGEAGRSPQVAQSPPPLRSRGEGNGLAPAARGQPPTATSPLPDIPRADAPLAQAFDALAQRARSGDSTASLRLLRDLGRCANRARTGEIANETDNLGEALQSEGDEFYAWSQAAFARQQKAARIEYEATASLCKDVAPAQIATLGEWLERSAESGDAVSKYCYALFAPWDEYAPERYSDEWIEWMQRYRARARAYAEEAFSAGLPPAALLLFSLSAGPSADMSLMVVDDGVAPDPERAYALALFIAQRMDAYPSDTQPPGSADDWRARAQLLQQRLSPEAAVRAQEWARSQAARFAAPSPFDDRCGSVGELL